MDNRITPEMARKELARRELERRGASIDKYDSLEESQKQSMRDMNYATGQNRSGIDTARDLLHGIVTGLGKGGQLLGEGLEKIPGFPSLQRGVQNLTGLSIPKVNMNETFGFIGSPNKSIGGEITKGIGEYLPYGIAGGSSLPGQLLAGAASGAAQTNPNQENMMGFLPSGRIGGAIEGAGLNLAGAGIGRAINALRPSQMFRGNLSPQELQKNLEITKGTETGLGDVIESPFLKKRLENTLSVVPFSGANESLQRTGNVVVKKGEDLLNNMLGKEDPHSVPEILTKDLINQHNIHKEQKELFYNEFNNIADENKLTPRLSRFMESLNKNKSVLNKLKALNSDPLGKELFDKVASSTRVLEKPSFVSRTIQAEVPSEEIIRNPITGLPEAQQATRKVSQTSRTESNREGFTPLGSNALPSSYIPSYRDVNILKGRLNDYAKSSGYSSDTTDRQLANVYKNLGQALKADIHDSVKNSGNELLESSYKKAEENYAKNYSKFLDKDIYKFISQEKPAETLIGHFIKTSPTQDLASQITKLAKGISPQSKDLLAYSYFSRALNNEGKLNPTKLGNAIEKLGHNQFKELVPDKTMRKSLKDYSKLQHMNKEAQNLMFNPKTGQRNTDVIMTGLLGLAGKLSQGNIGAMAAIGLPIAAGKILTKALTSPSVRESIVNAMTKNKSWKKPITYTIQTGAQGTSNS